MVLRTFFQIIPQIFFRLDYFEKYYELSTFELKITNHIKCTNILCLQFSYFLFKLQLNKKMSPIIFKVYLKIINTFN